MRKFLRHLFFPHESNNHRAKILHVDSILIIISLLVFFSFLLSSLQNTFPQVLGISFDIAPIDLLNTTNQIRKEHGLAPLRLDSELSQAASNKANDMFAKNYWAHIAPDGVTPWIFIKNSGYEYLYAGENLARGFSSTSEVVTAWMASPSHRDNMLSGNYSDVGFAVATGTLTDSDTVLIVEMFGSRYIENKPETPVVLNPTSPVAYLATTITPAPSGRKQAQIQVASVQQQPLIDKNDLTQKMVITVLITLIAILAIDAIVIERKKIIRVVSHNLDHIIYLIIILLTILVIGKGLVL